MCTTRETPALPGVDAPALQGGTVARNRTQDDTALTEIRELMRLFERSSIVDLEAAWGGTKLTLRKGEHPEGTVPASVKAERPQENERAVEELELTVVRAPAVGRFWRGSAAGSAALVEKGKRVRAGQHVATIEALTAPVEVLAGRDGELEQILAEDGQAVGYGDPLFVIRPDHA